MADFVLMMSKDKKPLEEAFAIVSTGSTEQAKARSHGWVVYTDSPALIPKKVAERIADMEKNGNKVDRPKPENAR